MDKDLYPFEKYKPDFENEDGVKYWEIECLNKKLKAIDSPNRAYNVLLSGGKKERILTDGKGVFFSTTDFETICQRVDLEILIKEKK